MRRHVVAFVFVSLPLATVIGQTQSRTAVETGSLDRSADPCTDFYQFACGGWIEKNPLPADRRSYGRIQEVQDRNFAILRRILETPGATGDARKASDYYAACVDTAAIEARGLRPLQPLLARIDALSSREQLPGLVGYLHRVAAEPPPLGSPSAASAYPFFSLVARSDPSDAQKQMAWVRPDGLALPDRDYYLKTDERSVALRREYRAHVERMLNLAGASADRATAGADAVLAIETSLAGASLGCGGPARSERVEPPDDGLPSCRRWRPASIGNATSPQPACRRSISSSSPSPSSSKRSAASRSARRSTTSRATCDGIWSTAPRWCSRRRSSTPTSSSSAASLLGQQRQQPLWRRCVTRTDEQLGEALGQAFVAEAFGPQAKQDMLRMVKDIKAALARDINGLAWMSEATKTAALEKLSAVEDRIGYPDKWRDYSAIRTAPDDAFGNLVRVREWANARDRARIDRPTDRGEWAMTPPTVNSYYSSDRNSINFPAGILQPPFYQAGRDAALNYGSAGGLIGHEMTHGFDDQGRKFDTQGNLRNWWTAEDGKAFETRAACFADQYSDYTVAGDTHINGRLTLGENTADNGGLRLALMAYLAGPGATARATRWTASRRSSACFSAGRRAGVKTRDPRRSA